MLSLKADTHPWSVPVPAEPKVGDIIRIIALPEQLEEIFIEEYEARYIRDTFHNIGTIIGILPDDKYSIEFTYLGIESVDWVFRQKDFELL